jgi:competence protein ComEA
VDEPTPEQPSKVRLRLTLGAGVVLVLVGATVAVLVAALAPHGVSGAVQRPPSSGSTGAVHSASPADSNVPAQYVHVVGAVRVPGVYELPAGDRVIDAIAAAGGFTAAADQGQVNLARVIADGEQLVVPKKGQVPTSPGATGTGKVDINTADLTALETLDGIGPALAQRILDYRESKGGFSAVTDLRNIAGIGDKKFAAIKDHVTT